VDRSGPLSPSNALLDSRVLGPGNDCPRPVICSTSALSARWLGVRRVSLEDGGGAPAFSTALRHDGAGALGGVGTIAMILTSPDLKPAAHRPRARRPVRGSERFLATYGEGPSSSIAARSHKGIVAARRAPLRADVAGDHRRPTRSLYHNHRAALRLRRMAAMVSSGISRISRCRSVRIPRRFAIASPAAVTSTSPGALN